MADRTVPAVAGRWTSRDDTMNRTRVSQAMRLAGIAAATAILIALTWLATLSATRSERADAQARIAASMANQGQIYATDEDGRRLAPIFDRLARSGARNVQVRAPRGQADVLADLEGRCDLVMIDAPCTGSGAWRRNPDAKWRIRPGALEQRVKNQDETLEKAVRFVKRGGRIVYVTCSLLRLENEDRVAEFLSRHDDMLPVDAAAQARSAGLAELAEHRSAFGPGFRLSPRSTGTDGFYIATLTRL